MDRKINVLLQMVGEIEATSVAVGERSDLLDLMYEYATTPKRLWRLVDLFASTRSPEVRASLVFVCATRNRDEFHDSAISMACTLADTWNPQRDPSELLQTLFTVIETEVRKTRLPPADYTAIERLVLECMVLKPGSPGWGLVCIAVVELLNALIWRRQIELVFAGERRRVLATRLHELLAELEKADPDAFGPWIQTGYKVLSSRSLRAHSAKT